MKHENWIWTGDWQLEVQTEVHTSDPTMAGIWDIWREMLRNNCTTCVEADTDPRSECHAWGSLALYEPPSVILGVRPGAPGYGKILVRPVPGYLTGASGQVVTPRGLIGVSWALREGDVQTEIQCDPALREDVILY